MAVKFIIPSIFTAVNQISPTMATMRHDVLGFANAAETGIARVDRTVRKLIPGLGSVQKELLSMAGTAAVVAGAFALGSFSFNALADYETAVDSFRVIVSDLNDTDFKPFQDEINRVAVDTKRSGSEVAAAFEQIASKNAKFAETSQGLGQVTKAAITLAKASRMDLGIAAENLVGIMNQFSFSADKADRTINALAAGQAVGAASITQTAEAFVNLGPTAATANISLEESVGLIQTLAKFSLYGADAGTALRGSIIKLQKAGLGYKSGQFSINDALRETNERLDKLHTAKKKDALITDIFGIHNITAGRILTGNVETYNEFTRAVSNTSEAQKGAAINSGNLRTVISQLSAAWVNMLTTSTTTGSVMAKISDAAQWLAANLEAVVSAVVTGIEVMIGYKLVMLAAKTAMLAWNVTLGISAALQGASSLAMKENTVALTAQSLILPLVKTRLMGATVATEAATGATLGFNAVLAANPIGVVLLGITALAAGIGYLVYREKSLNEEFETYLKLKTATAIDAERKAVDQLTESYIKNGKTKKEAIALSIQQRMVEVNAAISNAEGRIRRANTVMSNENSTSANYQAAQRERQNATSDLLFRRESSSALQQETIRAGNAGLISGTNVYNLTQGKALNFMPQDKVDSYKNSMSGQQTKEMPEDFSSNVEQVKEILKETMNATITIKNDSASPVDVAGKNKSFSVMPGITSTMNGGK